MSLTLLEMVHIFYIIKKGEEIITQSYDKVLSQGEFIENCVSRKKNVIPLIMDAIEG